MTFLLNRGFQQSASQITSFLKMNLIAEINILQVVDIIFDKQFFG